MTDGLQGALEGFIEALRQHAEAMSAGNALTAPAAMSANNSLRDAARKYVEKVFESTGWGNVFDDLFEDEDDVGDGVPDESARDTGTARTVVSVRARYDYEVPNEDLLLRAAQELRSHDSATSSDPVVDIGDAIYELLHAAGRPFVGLDVPELKSGSGFVVIHATEDPLEADDLRGDVDVEDLVELLAPSDEDELIYAVEEPRVPSHEAAENAARRDAGDHPRKS